MGVGYVPTGSLRQEREGDDFPRRQHRGVGAYLRPLDADGYRKHLGGLGEAIAARFLVDRGAKIVGRNIRVGRGELDLIVSWEGRPVAVEVKTATGDVDPVFHFDELKQAQVRSLAAGRGIRRVDFVGVLVTGDGVLVRWLPAVA